MTFYKHIDEVLNGDLVQVINHPGEYVVVHRFDHREGSSSKASRCITLVAYQDVKNARTDPPMYRFHLDRELDMNNREYMPLRDLRKIGYVFLKRKVVSTFSIGTRLDESQGMAKGHVINTCVGATNART